MKSLNFITAYNYTYLHDSDSGKCRLTWFTHRWLYCRQRLTFPNILRSNITNSIPYDAISGTYVTYAFRIHNFAIM